MPLTERLEGPYWQSDARNRQHRGPYWQSHTLHWQHLGPYWQSHTLHWQHLGPYWQSHTMNTWCLIGKATQYIGNTWCFTGKTKQYTGNTWCLTGKATQWTLGALLAKPHNGHSVPYWQSHTMDRQHFCIYTDSFVSFFSFPTREEGNCFSPLSQVDHFSVSNQHL